MDAAQAASASGFPPLPHRRFRGRAVTVMGLGRFGGGVGAARYLARLGARVTVTDLKGPESLGPSVAALEGLPVALHLGGHREADFTGAEAVVVSPAVPKSSPYLALAREAGAEITSEMNLFLEACPAPVVGVTGSSGKSTTTALLGAMLARARPTRVGGNIGVSLLEDLPAIGPEEVVVLELSSFQLEDLARLGRSPRVAVVTNISPNHLDRHGTMDAYIDAKKNILRFQGRDDVAVLAADDPVVRTWAAEAPGRVLFFSLDGPVTEGAWAEGGEVVFRLEGREERADLGSVLRLRGRHNLANALAAAVAARVMGAGLDDVLAAAASFEPLPHRLEPVAEVDGVLYVNDSKATTPRAAVVAMEAFEAPVVLIAGGYDKHLDPSPMVEAARRRARAVVLLGTTAPALAEALGPDGPTVVRVEDLPEAVRQAARLAQRGDVVLLAPGHASWDMFENYEQRGEVFRREVQRLRGERPHGA